MKMTLHINENVLAEVMEAHGFDTKTEAVNFALRELDRRKKLRAYQDVGLGLTPEELKDAVFENYSPDAPLAGMVAEAPKPYNSPQKKK